MNVGKGRKIRFVLRRRDVNSPFVWWPVVSRAIALSDWPNVELFTYREGPIVSVVEARTGVSVAFAASLPLAKLAATQMFAEHGAEAILESCREVHDKLNPGKKPRLKK